MMSYPFFLLILIRRKEMYSLSPRSLYSSCTGTINDLLCIDLFFDTSLDNKSFINICMSSKWSKTNHRRKEDTYCNEGTTWREHKEKIKEGVSDLHRVYKMELRQHKERLDSLLGIAYRDYPSIQIFYQKPTMKAHVNNFLHQSTMRHQ